MRLLVVLLAGCSLMSKSKPIEVRYFALEATAAAPRTTATALGPLRLARVVAGAHLHYRIAQRESSVELSLYDTRRWTEPPERYVRRSLERALFETRGFEEVTGGSALALDVDLLSFEEVRHPLPHGRVQLRYRLRADRAVVATGVVTTERPALTRDFDAVVHAIGGALDDATSQVADAVVAYVAPPMH